METSRSNMPLILAVNAVISAVLVAAGLFVLAPKKSTAAPPPTKELEARIHTQADEIEALRALCGTLGTKIGTANERITELERAREAMAAAAEAPVVEAAADEKAAAPAEDALARSIQSMMKQQIERQRARFIDEIVNPTDESRARAERQVRQQAERMARAAGLDERDSKQVERILTQVDERRREKLRALFTGKSDPKDVTYPEVKEVLDESFEEEDRQIEQTLPREKADDYKEAAEPFRGFVDNMAKAAFPSGTEEKR